MPPSAFRRTGNGTNFLYNARDALVIVCISGFVANRKQQNTGLNIVQVSKRNFLDAAVCIEHTVNPVLGIFKITVVPAFLPGFHHAGEENALVIMEMPLRRKICSLIFAHHRFTCCLGISQCIKRSTVCIGGHSHGSTHPFCCLYLYCNLLPLQMQ